MTTLLLSFLGRSPKRDGGYRQTDYRFDDGSVDQAAFFGFSLLRRIRPERLVVMGTAGSMWDHLFERDVALGAEAESERLELMDAVADKTVTQDQLDRVAPTLASVLGCAVELKLIPYAREEAEQVAIVRAIAEAAADAAQLHLDITHGFRHLPMLAMMALQYLRAVRPSVAVKAVWYGAFDEDSGEAPVHELSGLLKIAEGAAALARFDANGDYAALSALVPEDPRKHLCQAAFYERTQQVGKAREPIRKARAVLETDPPGALPNLFRDALRKRLVWADEERLYQRQRALALQHLGRGDELRAALFGFEAFITRYMYTQPVAGADPGNFDHRQQARARYEEAGRSTRGAEFEDYKMLRDIRNQLAHGIGSPRVEVQRVFANENALRDALAGLMQRLLPG
ncbi:MAG: TIGR02221 family CRISPR-associated protein [Pseudomonadota bacterium]